MVKNFTNHLGGIMYALLNVFDTTATRNVLRALLLTALIAIVFVATYYAAAVVLPLLVAALSAAVAVAVTVTSAVLSAAAYAVTVLAAVAVRMVVIAALVRALPWVWRAAVALYGHREGLLIAAKGLCFAGLVVGCFLGAILVAPLVLAVAGKVIIASAVMAGAIVSGKVM